MLPKSDLKSLDPKSKSVLLVLTDSFVKNLTGENKTIFKALFSSTTHTEDS